MIELTRVSRYIAIAKAAAMCVEIARNAPFGLYKWMKVNYPSQSVFRLGYLRNFFASRLSWDFDLKIRKEKGQRRGASNAPTVYRRSGQLIWWAGANDLNDLPPQAKGNENPTRLKRLQTLTANYTRWWLLRWSQSIIYPLAYKPFWRNIIFHYFNFILHFVMPSVRDSVPFSRRLSDIRFSLCPLLPPLLGSFFCVVVFFLFCQANITFSTC